MFLENRISDRNQDHTTQIIDLLFGFCKTNCYFRTEVNSRDVATMSCFKFFVNFVMISVKSGSATCGWRMADADEKIRMEKCGCGKNANRVKGIDIYINITAKNIIL